MVDYAVRVHDVSKVYRSGDIEVNALRNVSFALKRGEFAAVVGPSGSGKSSLMHILGTIDKPTSGEVYIDGVPTAKMDGNELAEFRNSRLGFVFQFYNLVNGLDSQTNVALPLFARGIQASRRNKLAEDLLRRLGLAGSLRLKPTQLSGGQQQRVAVARALIGDPTLILADEPTGSLDSKSGDEVMALFKEVSVERGVTTVIVTHNLDITKRCGRILHIKDGRLEKEEVRK